MRFELKIRHTFYESFDTKQELFDFLRKEQVVFELARNIEPQDIPGEMTYLGDVKSVGVRYGHEKALYVYYFTQTEFAVLKEELKELETELAAKWKKVAA